MNKSLKDTFEPSEFEFSIVNSLDSSECDIIIKVIVELNNAFYQYKLNRVHLLV